MPVCVGDILLLYVEEFKKDKFFIILGENDEHFAFATFYINSNKNYNFIPNSEVENYHIELHPKDFGFLKYPSWLNLTEVFPKSKEYINDEFDRDPSCRKYHLNEEQLEAFRDLIRQSPTIKGKIVKRFGFYDEK